MNTIKDFNVGDKFETNIAGTDVLLEIAKVEEVSPNRKRFHVRYNDGEMDFCYHEFLNTCKQVADG